LSLMVIFFLTSSETCGGGRVGDPEPLYPKGCCQFTPKPGVNIPPTQFIMEGRYCKDGTLYTAHYLGDGSKCP